MINDKFITASLPVLNLFKVPVGGGVVVCCGTAFKREPLDATDLDLEALVSAALGRTITTGAVVAAAGLLSLKKLVIIKI